MLLSYSSGYGKILNVFFLFLRFTFVFGMKRYSATGMVQNSKQESLIFSFLFFSKSFVFFLSFFSDSYPRKTLDWFNFYLHNRTEQCLLNDFLSDVFSLKCGVPRRAILDPLLVLTGFLSLGFPLLDFPKPS